MFDIYFESTSFIRVENTLRVKYFLQRWLESKVERYLSRHYKKKWFLYNKKWFSFFWCLIWCSMFVLDLTNLIWIESTLRVKCFFSIDDSNLRWNNIYHAITKSSSFILEKKWFLFLCPVKCSMIILDPSIH